MSYTPKFPYCWTEGDRLPPLEVTYIDQDLTDFTVLLHLLRKDGSVVTKNATAIDLTQGYVRFDWAPGDLVAGFNQEAKIEFVDGAGLPLTSSVVLVDVAGQLS